MAKTIKFNLNCDGKPVRTIEELQSNFSIEDILAYYNNKLLQRWLIVRGYEKELEAVNGINAEKPIEIIKELISIFGIETDMNKIAEDIYMLEYLDERKELYSIYERDKFKTESIINDYQTGYIQLVDAIIENSQDISKIKSAISEILNNYYDIFKLDHVALFYKLYYNAPMSIFVMLTFNKARELYLPQKVETKDSNLSGIHLSGIKETSLDDIDGTYQNEKAIYMSNKKSMYRSICGLISTVSEILGDNMKSFSGITDGYWKDLEPGEKKYMVLSMDSGDLVRSAGERDGDLTSTDVTNRFVILNGIDYKSNTASHKLLYMEV